MGYLVCEKYGGYYELQKGESPANFDVCQCGGRLGYYDHIFDSLKEEKQSKNDMGGYQENFHNEKEELNKELEFYQNIRNESRISPYRSEKILLNSGAVILVFAICPFFYGITYNFWPLTIMGLITVFLSCWLYLNSRNKDKIAQETFMEKVYTIYGIFFVSIAIMFLIFLITNYNKMVSYGGYYLCFFIIFIAIYFSVITFVRYSVPYDPLSPRDPRSNIKVKFYSVPEYGIPQYEPYESQDPFNSKESVILVFPVVGILLIWIIGQL
jgi:hypothetical protein